MYRDRTKVRHAHFDQTVMIAERARNQYHTRTAHCREGNKWAGNETGACMNINRESELSLCRKRSVG